MNNPTNNDDLQKAIDDITNSTNADPVFGNPIAAPAAAPVAPAPAPMPEPISEPVSVPEPMPELPEEKPAEPAKPFPTVGATPITSTFNPAPMSAPMPAPIAPAPAPAPMPEPMPEPVQEVAEETYAEVEEAPATEELHGVKEKILRDLAPMVDRINASPSEKFNLYKDIHEKLHDDSVIASAYEVSKEITDEGERADALLYLYDSLK